MVSLTTPKLILNMKAPDFSLKGIDEKNWTLEQCAGEKGLLVMFICNHCPYVKAILERLVRDTNDLKKLGINSVAIMPNDTDNYPDDSFDNMKILSKDAAFDFPYLIDETQEVAKSYGAICTPDFFGFDANLELKYRGRLDASRKETAPADARRDLYEAMSELAINGRTSLEQYPSMGCSIKWKEE